MRLKSISFRCFGPFQELALDLTTTGGLQVVYGPNEAGKSAALRGLRALLFGFPVQTGDDFRFKYNQFRVHAVLENATGGTLECVRRKGNKDTLRAADDKETIPEGQLTAFLGGLDVVQFEQLFGLDASRLVEGGRTMAQGQGELGEALFAAGAGMKGFRVKAQELDERQQALYKAGGKKQPIAEMLRKHQELLRQERSCVLQVEAYAVAESEALAAREQVSTLNAERKNVRARLDELKRYQAALPTIALLLAAQEKLRPVADAPLLSTDFDAKLGTAREKLTIAHSQLLDQQHQVRDLAQLIRQEEPSAAILAEEQEIDELKKLVGADKKLRDEAVKADTFRRDEQGKARDLYRELTGSTDWVAMDELEVRLDERRRLLELANQHAAVLENLGLRTEAADELQAVLQRARTRLTEAPAPVEPLPWQAAVDQVMALGPLEDQVHKRGLANRTEERRLAAEFASFNPAAAGGWQDALALAVRLPETVDGFRSDLAKAGQIEASSAEALKQNHQEIAAAQAALTELTGADAVPTVGELEAARRDRDGGLSCIRCRLDGHAEEQAERSFIGRHAPGRPLLDAAAGAVHQCDVLADRLRYEADRVAASMAHQDKLRRLQEHRHDLEFQARCAAENLAELSQCWQSAWTPTGVVPGHPEVMQSWLTKWTKFRDRVAHWRNACQACQEDRDQIESMRKRLASACPAAQVATTLGDALALARTAIGRATAARTAVDKGREEVVRLEGELAKAEQTARLAGKRRGEWVGAWTAAVAVLRLNDSVPSVQTAQDYLTRIDRMQQHLRDMRIKDARVREIAADHQRLIDRIDRLRRRLDPVSALTTDETLEMGATAAPTDPPKTRGFSRSAIKPVDENRCESRQAVESAAAPF